MGVSGIGGKTIQVPIVDNVEVGYEDRATRQDLLLLPSAGFNLLGRDMQVQLGIGTVPSNGEIIVKLFALKEEDDQKIEPEESGFPKAKGSQRGAFWLFASLLRRQVRITDHLQHLCGQKDRDIEDLSQRCCTLKEAAQAAQARANDLEVRGTELACRLIKLQQARAARRSGWQPDPLKIPALVQCGDKLDAWLGDGDIWLDSDDEGVPEEPRSHNHPSPFSPELQHARPVTTRSQVHRREEGDEGETAGPSPSHSETTETRDFPPKELTQGKFIYGIARATIVVGAAKWEPIVIPPPSKIICNSQYRVPGGAQEIAESIQALLREGIIRTAVSLFNSPIWPVRKRNGSWRMTVDYRELNKAAPPLAAAVPDIVALIEDITGRPHKPWYAVVDLANAVFSIPLHSDSQDQFAFTWDSQQYTFCRLPQGYIHSPTICHGLVSRDLHNIQFPTEISIAHYIDDILLQGPSDTIVSKALHMLIESLRGRGWAINMEKIEGPSQGVIFLGVQWNSGHRNMPDAAKNKILNFAAPSNKTDTQRFVGLLGYWQQHIPHLTLLLRPLYRISRKNSTFLWGPAEQAAFDTVKLAVEQAMPLSSRQAGLPFELQVSVSETVAEWSLWKKTPGRRVPLGFWTKSLPLRAPAAWRSSPRNTKQAPTLSSFAPISP
ncbi:LOW QUALITY PROTEIN: uncharacterized protein [Hemitrygon akajei]|uniref:LOW QUALITY PROTEIN: uncharacterized protein n=1 Tax=Hemitrygon akajei TaxID=2704970 RepID=UPI003BFA23D1